MSEITTNAKSADREPNEAKTPTVRGFFRRGAWKQRLDACGLPAETRALVASTVQATKLRPAEKLAVADELIAHFHDADRQGMEPEQARRDFGDPAVAAKLIRRAKKRNRGWFWKLRVASRWAVLATVLIAAAVTLSFLSREPVVAVDYLARFNTAAGVVPDDRRAWPAFRDAMVALNDTDDLKLEDWRAEPGTPAAGPMNDWLIEQRTLVKALREVVQQPELGWLASRSFSKADLALFGEEMQPIPNPGDPISESLYATLMPHFAHLRHAARLLRFDAVRAAGEGDASTARTNLEGLFRLSAWADEPPGLLSSLESSSIQDIGRSGVYGVLQQAPDLLTEDDLLELQHAVRAAPVLAAHHFRGERMVFADLLQRLFSDNGRGGGQLTPEGAKHLNVIATPAFVKEWRHALLDDWLSMPRALTGWANTIRRTDRAALAAVFAEAVGSAEAELQRPLWDGWESAVDPVLNPHREDPAYSLVIELARGLACSRQHSAGRETSKSAALLALALHRHRLATGSFPDPDTGYADLIPAYLDATPLDPLHGTPLRWTIRDGQPVIYSLGADGDDDGGVAPTDDLGGNDAAFAPPEEAVNGDWIAWPPQ